MNSTLRLIFNEKWLKSEVCESANSTRCTVYGRIVKSCGYCSWIVAVTVHETPETRAKKENKKRVKHKRRRRISASKPTLYICTYQHIFVGCNNMLVIWLNSRTKNEKKKKKLNPYFFARKSCVCAKWCVINTSILEIGVDHYHQSLSYVAIEIYFAIPAWSHLCSYFYIPIIQVSILIFWVGGEC